MQGEIQMLNEKAIDSLIQPVIQRQENINIFVLTSIADKIGEIGTLSPSDIKKLKLLVQMGTDIRLLDKELARLCDLQIHDTKRIIRDVAIDANLDAKPLFDYRHKPFIPYEQNSKLQQYVKAVSERTSGTFVNLAKSKATGFLIRDLKNPSNLKFQSINDTYKSVVDEAIQSVRSGVDYRVAMRHTLKQLANSGIRRMVWDSGYTQRLDTTVRRNLLEGIRAINQLIEDENGRKLKADGKELSAHINCALDHEPFQGHMFTNEEFDRLQNNESFADINGEAFTAVDRVIGEYNCRHVAYSVILGVSKPRYTLEQLQAIIDKNHKGYTLPNGKHKTLYECTQIQRQLETKIRYAKEEQMMMKAAGNIEDAKRARKKVVKYTVELQKFSKACGLKLSKDRYSISGYRAI